MSVYYIIGSVVIGLGMLSIVFYLTSMLEKNKQRKSTRLALAGDRVQKYQRYLHVLPADTLPQDIQAILIEESIYNLKQILAVGPDPKASRLLTEAQEQQKKLKQQPVKPAQVPKAKSMREANEFKLHFKNLFKLLKYIGKTRKQHTTSINKNFKVLQSLFVETGAKVHLDIAETATQQSKLKLAMHHFKLASGEYARADSKKFAKQIRDLKVKVQAIDQQLKSNQPVIEPDAAEGESQSTDIDNQAKPQKKDRGLSRMFDEQASNQARRSLR